jgi:hypothetical protein
MQQSRRLHQLTIQLYPLCFKKIHQAQANPAHLQGMGHDVLKHVHFAHEMKAIMFGWNLQWINGIVKLKLTPESCMKIDENFLVI